MLLDSHQHFWLPARGDYPWLTPGLGALYRDFLPHDLRPLLAAHGVAKTILVQAAPTLAETEFLLDLAEGDGADFVAGVVGWLDFEAGDFPRQLDRLRQRGKLVGLRPAVEFIADDDWLARPRVVESAKRVGAAGLAFDLIVWPRHLPAALRLIEQTPGVRYVVDHIAKPNIKAREMEPWGSLIARVAGFPHVSCKLSGMAVQADHGRWAPADLRPYVEHVMECFGPERVMWGSDWPVCLLAGTFERTITSLREVLGAIMGVAVLERWEQAIFHDHAVRFYGLSGRA